jgi:hypothetical protein
MMDMPTSGNATKSRCASSSTGRGNTAGPALKLKILSLIIYLLESSFQFLVFSFE